jgi:hypothetical protein
MFRLGEYDEEDSKAIVQHLKDAGFKVDARSFLTVLTNSQAFLEGRQSELKGLVKDMDVYERYLDVLRSTVSPGITHEEFKDRLFIALDPSWKDVKALMEKYSDSSMEPSEEDAEKIFDAYNKLVEMTDVSDFIEDVIILNDIDIDQPAKEKLKDPILRIEVDPEGYDPDQKLLKEWTHVGLNKVYEVYVDEFSTPIFRDIDEEFQENYPDEYMQILGMGLLIEDLVEEPSVGKVDLESFAKRCTLDMSEDEEASITIDGSMVAEDIAKVLEKNGVVKIKGDVIKWRAVDGGKGQKKN